MFTPKWKKHAKHLLKGAQKFVHYKRDLLPEGRIPEILSRRDDLKKAIQARDKTAAIEAGKMLEETCENALPRYKAPSALAENVEVFFVAIAVALGIRAYYLQPFRIPTNSMYPTLNGLVGESLQRDEWPSLPVRLAQKASHGRSYIDFTTEKQRRIINIEDRPFLHFFSRVKMTFDDGSTRTLPGSIAALKQIGFMETLAQLADEQGMAGMPLNVKTIQNIVIPANTPVCVGYVDSGDLILVDKLSYHFRKPTPGEVFVFDTRGIKEIEQRNAREGAPSSHYIKRLIGVPGDTLELRGGLPQPGMTDTGIPIMVNHGALLYRNGEKAKEPGFLRVEAQKGKYENGYLTGENLMHGMPRKLRHFPSTGMSEYWAMGDNSAHSWDSRGWGSVKEYNVTGPAFIALWPFGSGHWGLID